MAPPNFEPPILIPPTPPIGSGPRIDSLTYQVLKAAIEELVWCEKRLGRYPTGLTEAIEEYFKGLDLPEILQEQHDRNKDRRQPS